MYKVNISIDDVSPHPRSSINVLDRCHELIDIFPDIKFTLFVPTAYWRVMDDPDQEPYYLHKHIKFCEALRRLNRQNFELGLHGHFHSSIVDRSNNDEFRYATYKEAKQTINKMFLECIESGLKEYFKPIIRPPAWRMTKEAIKAASDSGIVYFCLSKQDYAIKTYDGADKNVNTIYQTCNPPFLPLNLTEQTEIVYHACEWDRNYLNKTMKDELVKLLKVNKEEIKFCFIEDMI
jgi:predicted deacetylase